MSYGYSRLDASTLIIKAISVFCPAYDGVIADIERGLDNAGSVTQDDAFVQQLQQNLGISIDKNVAVDMARTACKAPLAGTGLYNAQQAMQQRYPRCTLSTVALVMAQGVRAYCPNRLG